MRHASNYDVCVSKNGKQCIWRAICEKNTVSDFFGSGVFQLVGKRPNPSNTANSLQATHPLDALKFAF